MSALDNSRSSSSWPASSRWSSAASGSAVYWWRRGLVVAGDATEGGDDPGIEAATTDGWVAQVDGGVPAGVQAGQGGADGDGLAGALTKPPSSVRRSHP